MPLVAFASFIVVVLFIWRISRSSNPGPASIWFVTIGVVFNFYAYFLSYDTAYGDERQRIFLGFSVVSCGILSFIVGVSFSRFVNGRALTSSGNFRGVQSGISDVENWKLYTEPGRARKILLIASSVILFPSWLYFLLLGYVPLFEGLASVGASGLDGLGALQTSRIGRDAYIGADQSRIPLQGLLELFRTVGTPFLVCLSIAQLRAGLPAKLRVLIIILAVTTALMAGQRWPLIYLVVAVIATFDFLRPLGISISRARVACTAGFLAFVGLVLSILQKRTESEITSFSEAVSFGLDNLVGRILIEQAQTPILSYLQESFESGQLKGRSYVEAVLAYLPGEAATFPVEFYQTVYKTSDAYTAPPDFFTEAYLNFSWVGVLFVPLMWGFLASYLDNARFTMDPITDVGIKGGVAAVFASTVFTGPSYLIGATIVVLAVVFALKFFGLFPKRGSNSSKVDWVSSVKI